MGDYVLLIVGIVSGGIAAAGLLGIVSYFKARAVYQKNEQRERIIASVEEKWIDVESIVRSYRSGRLNISAFRESLDGKIESINRLYMPSIHQLDIFFVKYTEKMIDEYGRMLEPGTAAVAVASPAPEEVPLPAVEVPGVAVTAPASSVEPPEPVSEIAFPVQVEEQIISEMTEAAVKDSNLQLESFLEMEPSAAEVVPVAVEMAEETVSPVHEHEKTAKEEETEFPLSDAGVLPHEPAVEPAFKDKGFLPPGAEVIEEPPREEPRPAVPEREPEAAPSLDKESSVPPPPPGMEVTDSDGMESETIIQSPESQFSFSGRVSSGQEFEPVPPPPPVVPPAPAMLPHPFTLPSRTPAGVRRISAVPPPPAAPPAFTKEEVAHPATIFDVEAETIIVDRGSIMGAQRSAPAAREPEGDKKSIGITGEDVSDTFDKFFGLGGK